MNESAAHTLDSPPPSTEELKRDRLLEALLDECVMASPRPAWEAGLTARVMAERPFAPWEVRRARVWRAPALVAGGLLAASLAVFLAPLWSLGPRTAFEMWVRVMAAGTAAGVPALFAAMPALANALGSALSGMPGIRAALAGALLASGVMFAVFAGRLSRRSSRRARALAAPPRG